MDSELPLEVIGLTAPLLCWVEGESGPRLPEAGTGSLLSAKEREERWLVGQLPTASLDKIEEIVAMARQPRAGVSPSPEQQRKLVLETRKRAPGARSNVPRLEPQKDVDLATVLSRLSRRYLVWSGGQVCIREGRMEELHELSLRLPVAHLIRQVHAEAVVADFIAADRAMELPEQVSLLPSNSYSLRTVVKRGLSEGHLHLNGVTNATDVWNQALLARRGLGTEGRWTRGDARLLFLGRCSAQVLALAILAGELSSSDSPCPLELVTRLDELYFARTPAEEWNAVERWLEAFKRAKEGFEEYLMAGLGAGGTARADLAWLVRWIDPGLLWLRSRSRQPATHEALGARTRLSKQLHFRAHLLLLDRSSKQGVVARHFLHQSLFRYLVLRTHHWQRATHQGRTTGLRYFRSFFGSEHRRPHARRGEYHRVVLDRLCSWRGLRVLEGRLSPPDNVASEILPWVVACAHEVGKGRLRKFGLVIHFIKEGFPSREKRLLESGFPCLRFGFLRRNVRRRALRLYRLLASPSPVAPFIVGIDAANLELTAPPEVFAPAFRFLRELPIERREQASSYADTLCLQPSLAALARRRRLGMTYHVGEDFRHLLSGMRAIFEMIEFLKPQPGDRLGHAIALALEPKVWAEQNGFQAVVPKLEWLDTLVWVHHFLGPGDDLVGELEIEDRIQRLSWEIYGPEKRRAKDLERDWSPLGLYDAWRLRQLDPYSIDLEALEKGGRLRCLPPMPGEQHHRWAYIQSRVVEEAHRYVGSRNAYHLLMLYWLNPNVRKTGEEVMLVDMQADRDRWLELCHNVEERMIEEVQRHQLVVEVNPTVNRFIGAMGRLEEHHVFRMTLNQQKRLSRRVRVTVNTDNPAVFNTSLSHQFYLLGESLIQQGEPEAEVVEWLEWLRKNGEDYSFVRQLPEVQGERGSEAMGRVITTVNQGRARYSLPSDSREEKLKRFWDRRETKPAET